MTQVIQLTRGQAAQVDDEDYEMLSAYKWQAQPCGKTFRAVHSSRSNRIDMARMITAAQPGQYVDHKNHDTLDNRRANLRLCTASQNAANSVRSTCWKNPYKGIAQSREKSLKNPRWFAFIRVQGERHYLGCFKSPEEAARAYDAAAKKQFGDFASINGV